MSNTQLRLLTLVVVGSLFLVLAITLWKPFLLSVISLQQELHSILRSHVASVAQAQTGGGLLLIGVSFAYGVFHAVGPGHGKAIITTYLTTQSDVQIRKGMLLSFCGALLQSLCAIALVGIVVAVIHTSLSNFSYQEWLMEIVSYCLIILLGCMICWRAVKHLIPKPKKLFEASQVSFQPVQPQSLKPLALTALNPHQHHQGCDCKHHVTAKSGDWKEQIPLIIAMGARPCTGALIVLTYAYIVKIFMYGVLAVLAMGVGTGITVAGLAYLVMKLRDRVLSWFPQMRQAERYPHLPTALKLIGGFTLIALGVLLLSATGAQPTKHPIL